MTNKKKSATDIKDLIKGVIKDNYSNPEFSVQSLTDKLRICVSYLREIVCDKFGISPLTFYREYHRNKNARLDIINYYKSMFIIA